jgi:hypothetical protein
MPLPALIGYVTEDFFTALLEVYINVDYAEEQNYHSRVVCIIVVNVYK